MTRENSTIGEKVPICFLASAQLESWLDAYQEALSKEMQAEEGRLANRSDVLRRLIIAGLRAKGFGPTDEG